MEKEIESDRVKEKPLQAKLSPRNADPNTREAAAAKPLEHASTTPDPDLKHSYKLVQCTKFRVRCSLDGNRPCGVVKQGGNQLRRPVALKRHSVKHTNPTSKRRTIKNVVSPSRSPALPNEVASFDLFLRAMQALIARERQEFLLRQQGSPDTVFIALMEGMAYWRNDAFEVARKAFGRAAENVTKDLQAPVVQVSRITYCISSLIWGSVREPIFQKFSQFMANATLEILGHACPLTIVIQHLQKEQSLDAQVAIWACALDKYEISEQNVDHWWNMARRRWQWCRRSGMTDLAVRYRSHALAETRRIKKLTRDMELKAQQDLGSVALGTSF